MKTKPHILFVDDETSVLEGLRRMLRPLRARWEFSFVTSVAEALDQLVDTTIDAVVCDVMMPVDDGFALLARLRDSEEMRSIPVVMLTGAQDRDLKRRSLEMGATDLLNKPIDVQDLTARLTNALQLKSYEDKLRCQNESLEHLVRLRTEQLADSRLELVWRLGKAAEYRDRETGNHVIRVGCYSRIIGHAMELESDFVESLFIASPMHDVGKIGIPDGILLKEGSLTDGERRIMQQHCVIGADILRSKRPTQDMLKHGTFQSVSEALASDPLLDLAASIALCHHERWDGRGYPHGLSEETIPIEARIVALADVFDALRSARPYKPAFPRERVLDIIADEAESHFDPQVCAAFMASLGEIFDIENALTDTPSPGLSEEVVHETHSVR